MLKTTRVPRKRKRRTGIKLNSGTPSPPIESGSLNYSLNFPPLTESGNSCDTPPLLMESRSNSSCDAPPNLMESQSNSSCDTPPLLMESRSNSSCDTPLQMESRSNSSCDTPPLLMESRSNINQPKSSLTPQQNVKKFSECSSTQKFYRLKKV